MSVTIQEVITPGKEKAFTVGKSTEASLADLDPIYMQLLDGVVTAALATVNSKGEPQLTPVWVNQSNGLLNLNSVRGRLKDRNMRKQPDVCLMFLNPQNPYHWMTIWGKIERIIDEDDAKDGHLATESIDDLAALYLGQRPYPLRDPNGEVRVLYQVRPTRIQTFGQP